MISVFDNSGNGRFVDSLMVKIDDKGIAYIDFREISEEKRPKDGKNTQLIYPAKFYKQTTDRGGKTTFKAAIPKVQDGTFKKANICFASDIDFSNCKAEFQLAATLLKFDLSKLPDGINITNLILSSDLPINADSDTDQFGYSYTTVNFSQTDPHKIYYVAINSLLNADFYIESKDPSYLWHLPSAFFDTNRIYPIELTF